MTQQAAAPAPGAAHPADSPATGRVEGAAGAHRSTVTATASGAPQGRNTPRRLRRLTTAVIALGLVFGLLGLTAFVLLNASLRRAQAASTQTIRVQEIQVNLLRADANATNAFLVGGLEPARQRQAFDDAIQASSRLIAEAAEAEPADQAALAQLNTELLAYIGNVELARANNRQGFPVGAQYLRTASSELRADALPILQNLVDANTQRAHSQMTAYSALPFAAGMLILLVGLVWVQVRLARQFKRRFNIGLAAATGVGALAVVLGAILITWAALALGDLRTGALADVRAASDARVAGNDAKSNESLTLIARGSGGAFEEAWKRSAESVQADIARFRDLNQVWQPYVDVHTEIRALDDGGQWERAVRLAITDSNTAFTGFDEAISAIVESSSTATIEGLHKLVPWMVLGAVLAAAAGIAMAILARGGVLQRLKEYR